nr:MAG TPA: hypothetical protein [Caudoviricetes sp.]DAQ89118.1 MAG TPA: hypothetical protein [Caudoviricetes sp.]
MQSYPTFHFSLALRHILSKRLISWLFFILFVRKIRYFGQHLDYSFEL